MIYLGLIEDEEERSKFEELYHEYSRLMRYRAYEILKDPYLAEDAVHHAFLKIMNNLHKIKEVKCNKTKHFLVVVTERAAIDIYHKNHRVDSVPFEKLDERQSMGMEQELLEKVYLNEIETVIYQLPDIYREIFILKYSNECTNREIGKILGMKEGTVRQRLARGKAILKEKLLEMGLYEE